MFFLLILIYYLIPLVNFLTNYFFFVYCWEEISLIRMFIRAALQMWIKTYNEGEVYKAVDEMWKLCLQQSCTGVTNTSPPTPCNQVIKWTWSSIYSFKSCKTENKVSNLKYFSNRLKIHYKSWLVHRSTWHVYELRQTAASWSLPVAVTKTF